MDSIAQKAQETFAKNMAHFQVFHPDLYEKLAAYEKAVAGGHYTPRYELEYKDEGYFDVLEPATGRWLYGMDSAKHADVIAESIDYGKTDNLFETFREFPVDENAMRQYESFSLDESAMPTIAPIVRYILPLTDKHRTTMKKIYKFIFLGVGLGLHITKTDSKIDSDVYLIIEDDLELFRLSMFVTDYTRLARNNKVVIYAVFEEDEIFRQKVYAFLKERFVYNHYLKFFPLLSHDTARLKQIQATIISMNYLKFPHSAMLQVFLRPYRYILEAYRYSNIEALKKERYFGGRPLLLLGAGPSLQKNIEWVRRYQDRFVIVTVSAAMGKLEQAGIRPELILHVDGFKESMKHLERVADLGYFDESIPFFSSFTWPDFAKAFQKERVCLFQAAAQIKKDFGQITASNVGLMMCAMGMMFGAEEIYVLGVDLALEPETGATHIDGHVHAKQLDITKETALEERISFHKTVLKTAGNLRDEVPTTPNYMAAVNEMDIITQGLLQEGQHIYNLSDGARLYGMTPKRVEEVEVERFAVLDKEAVKKELFERLLDVSEVGLREEELEIVRGRIAHADYILGLLEKFSARKFNNIDIYHYELLGLFLDILVEERREEVIDANDMVTVYLQLIGGYLFDFINTREIDNPKHHIKKINKLFTEQFSRFISFYKERLEAFVEAYEKNPPKA